MNKILIGKKITTNSDKVKINGKEITFLEDNLYEVEYTQDGDYNIIFVSNDNITLLEYALDKKINCHNKYVIESGSLEVYKFYNNYEVDEVIDIDLCSEESNINYKFSSICRHDEKYVINVNHLNKFTNSNIINKAVATENSKIDFTINSNVPKTSNGSILDQNTRIVTMGDSDAKISPNMFVDLDDVVAKHGSVIGTFKDEDIFYIMSKGISYNDTLKLLIKGFLLSNMIANHEFIKKIIDIINLYWR